MATFSEGINVAVFAGEGRFDAAVEEVGDVRELLRLGHAQVAQLVLRREHWPECCPSTPAE